MLFLYIILILILNLIYILIPSKNILFLRFMSFFTPLIIFLSTVFLGFLWNPSLGEFQFVEEIGFINDKVKWSIGLDGLNLIFILFTTGLIPIIVLLNLNLTIYRLKDYCIKYFLTELFLIYFFLSLDLLFFFIFFELTLIPMFLLIINWGHRSNKFRAAFLFISFSFLGSLFLLFSIIQIYLSLGTLDYETLYFTRIVAPLFDFNLELFIWLAFFIAFAFKIPIYPFHIWLPEAHVEAPTAGSVMLAGVLLKLGTYGILRVSLPLFPDASFFFLPLVLTLSFISLVFLSASALRQVDAKKVIAYSSIVHMNFIVFRIIF
jgi:NADH-quinone oxidoreductase subunit M